MKRMKEIWKRFLLWVGAVALLLTVGCAKAPVEDVAAKKNTEQLVEIATIGLETTAPASEATTAPEATVPGPISPLYEKLGAPVRYQAALTPDTDKLVITVDADVLLPNVTGMPTVRVSARDFTQDEVTRLFNAFCGDTVMYKARTQGTREEIQKQIQYFEEELETATGARREKVEDNIAYYERELAAAPETVTNEVTDGTLYETQLGINEYLGKYLLLDALEFPDDYDNGRAFRVSNNTYDINTKSDYDFPIGACVSYRYRPRRVGKTGKHAYAWIADESVVPAAANGELALTPAEARRQVEAIWDSCGFPDMAVSRVWLAYNCGNEIDPISADDTYGQKHVYVVTCAEAVGGVAPRTVGASWPNLRWGYESCSFVVGDMGVERFLWGSPYAYEETVTTDTVLLPFARIDEIFQKLMLTKYESQTHGNSDAKLFEYHVDHVALELQRIGEQGSDDTGLLIPVWNFYGSYRFSYLSDDLVYGSAERGGFPNALLSINAIDGSIIDESQGY